MAGTGACPYDYFGGNGAFNRGVFGEDGDKKRGPEVAREHMARDRAGLPA